MSVENFQLLAYTQELLEKKLHAAKEQAEAYGPVRAGWAASTLRLDAYRQVFETLINSMTTYRPIMTRIRKHYDKALDEALKVSFEHVHMQAELAISESRQAQAVDAALTESANLALQLRKQLLQQLATAEERAQEAEAAAVQKNAAVKDAQQQLTHLNRKTYDLRQENLRLLQSLKQRSSWAQMPAAVKRLEGTGVVSPQAVP